MGSVHIMHYVDKYIYLVCQGSFPEVSSSYWSKFDTVHHVCHYIIDGVSVLTKGYQPNPSLITANLCYSYIFVGTFQDDCIQARIAFEKRNTLSSLEASGPL